MAYRPLTDIPISLLTASSTMASGYVLKAYLTNTTTPATLYSDASGTSAGTSITLDARGEPTTIKRVWLDTAVNYKLVLETDGGAVVWTADPVYGVVAGTFLQSGTGAVEREANAKMGETPSILDFDAVADGATDIYTAITNALAEHGHVIVPTGDYAVGEMIIIPAGKTLELKSGATITRLSSLSTSTDPVVWLYGSGSTLIGANRNACLITTENDSPNGVVRIGFEDELETGRTIRNCRLEHLKIAGATGDGKTSGDPDVCVYVPCASGEQNYYHTISDLMLSDSNHGIWLHGESNGHQISKIWGESLGNASLDGVMLYFHGGSDCTVSQAFMSGNGASGAGAILMKFSNLGSSRSTHNHITGLVGEMGVSGLLVESTDTTTSAPVSNYIQGIDNTGGNNVNDDFWNNNFAAINDFPSTKGGFRFPQTASTSSDSNVLDYYRETQTYATSPYIDSATAGTGRSTTVNHARWTRIGNICYVSLRVTMATLGSGGSGNVRIKGGLPFASISDSSNYLGGFEVPNYENLLTGVRTIKAAALPGSTDIAIYITTTDAVANAQMDFATYIQATTQFYITGFYVVA